MKTIDKVSQDKKRGGFYSPAWLVDICYDRIAELVNTTDLSVLEPSVGDGAFLDRLQKHQLKDKINKFVGIEIEEEEAEKCRRLALESNINCQILNLNTLEWTATTDELFDIAVGNPPFVRYQFVSNKDLQYAEWLKLKVGLPLKGVSNLWILVLLGALTRLKLYGNMAFVVPAELFTGLSAGDARFWLLSNFSDLQIDLFKPGSFPNVLQEVVILSGKKVSEHDLPASKNKIKFVEHDYNGVIETWTHSLPKNFSSWTRYLLSPSQLEVFEFVKTFNEIKNFEEIAKLEVSIVTGANDFFSVSEEEARKYNLNQWVTPLLPRLRHAQGLTYTLDDHQNTVSEGAKTWLLNFSENLPDPQHCTEPSKYLAIGEAQNLHKRYKTSIRSPWYRVPSVWAGNLLLSKRCHLFPRLVYNEAGVVTTDTIYRGHILPKFAGRELDLVSVFNNSLTLLSAEIEGRSFGGGVLELVPSEIARLSIPFPVTLTDNFKKLDQISRNNNNPFSSTSLIEETNFLASQKIPKLTFSLLQILEQARESLMKRRLSRN
jgi:adenine-specific DNA-methyltransferase